MFDHTNDNEDTGGLDIPDFLRRSTSQRTSGPVIDKPRKARSPKSNNKLVQIHLADEAPKIGSGQRAVEVVSLGHKWVTIRYMRGGPKGHPVRHKFRRNVWEKLLVA